MVRGRCLLLSGTALGLGVAAAFLAFRTTAELCRWDSSEPPLVVTSGTAFPPFHEPFVPARVCVDASLQPPARPWLKPRGGPSLFAFAEPGEGGAVRLVLKPAMDDEGWTVCVELDGLESEAPTARAYAYRRKADLSGNVSEPKYLRDVECVVAVGPESPGAIEFRLRGSLGCFRSAELTGGMALQ